MEEVIKEILENTKLYEEKYDKNARNINCQFFTPSDVASYMCNMFNQNFDRTVRVLDPCGGTGILDAYILKQLIESNKVDEIILDIYEVDDKVISVLENNMNLIKSKVEGNFNLKINIIKGNYIIENKKQWENKTNGVYDLIIGNPPYKKIGKGNKEPLIMSEIVFGQPNLYMLFLAMSISLLKDGGELVFLIPRSFCNGKYFKKFREWMNLNCYISYIHSFEDRNKIINDEVLQELIILKLEKNKKDMVIVGHSKNNLDIYDSRIELIRSEVIWEKSEMKRIRLPLANGDSELLKKFDMLPMNFKEVGIIFSTGQIVHFRVKEGLMSVQNERTVPLIWSAHFGNHTIRWPIKKKDLQQYIMKDKNCSNLMRASDFILVKRFSSKEENSIKINILLKDNILAEYVGIENHVNYAKFDKDNKKLLMATFILLRSQIYNRYFKIINGTTQINVSDLNALPCFEIDTMIRIGMQAEKRQIDELTEDECNKIVNKYLQLECNKE